MMPHDTTHMQTRLLPRSPTLATAYDEVGSRQRRHWRRFPPPHLQLLTGPMSGSTQMLGTHEHDQWQHTYMPASLRA